jgi:PleD family two-component response regulator
MLLSARTAPAPSRWPPRLRTADRALYAAKQGGRDRVELAAAADTPVA